MQDFQPRDQGRAPLQDVAGVSYFASQVVSLLAGRSTRLEAELREPLVESLIEASLTGARDAFGALLAEMRRSRISLPALADLYLPEAARRMGDAWLQDEMSWMDVSIGVARMQSLLREIGATWMADRVDDGGQGTVMLLVPAGEQHTLGPMVALGQLRRYGVSVCLRIAPGEEELRGLMVSRHFDGIFISAATKDVLVPVARTVRVLRANMLKPCPVVVGGAVMSKVEDPASCTGADFSCNDVGAALETIGLKFDASCVLRRA